MLLETLLESFSNETTKNNSYQVTKTQDSLSVCNNDRSDVVFGPVSKDVVDVTLVVDGDEETLNVQLSFTVNALRVERINLTSRGRGPGRGVF